MAKTQGFRPFMVTAKIRESDTITSFHLTACDREHWTSFKTGQYLTLRVPSAQGTEQRNYTVSSFSAETATYRITVKRETASSAQYPDGLASSWLHDRVEIGAHIDIDGPHGAFTLDETSCRPVVLLSGGVGLTPMVAMLRALVEQSDRPVWFIHATDHGGVHALREDVLWLAAARDNIRVHFCYRTPRVEDEKLFHSTGLLSKEALQALLPLDDYDVYMCGPLPFMQAMYDLLTDLGIAENRIAYEFFGVGSRLKKTSSSLTATAVVTAEPSLSGDAVSVALAVSGQVLPWNDKSPSLLDFLEDNGFELAFSCRAGICGSCVQRLVSGTVSYFEEPLDGPQPGQVLLCCAKPQSTIVLDL